MILNLCKLTIDRTTNIETLQATATMLREQLTELNKQVISSNFMSGSQGFLPEIEIESFRQAAISSMWFMVENDLITSRLIAGPERREGF